MKPLKLILWSIEKMSLKTRLHKYRKDNEIGEKDIVNLLIIGFGPYARKVYAEIIKENNQRYGGYSNLQLQGVVDVKEKEDEVRTFLKENGFLHTRTLGVKEDLRYNQYLDNETRRELDDMVKDGDVDGVIISTEPLSHEAYARWTLENRIHTLLDKPITLRRDVSLDEDQARGLLYDYNKLASLYGKALHERPELIFSVHVQRRYNFNFLRDNIRDVFNETNHPISNITLSYNDGQWRLPEELLNERYHGYHEGYGICGHSGYHFLDMISWFMKIAQSPEKPIDHIRIYSRFVRPRDILYQFNYRDLRRLFGDDFNTDISEGDFIHKARSLGEVDAHMMLDFLSDDYIVTTVNLSLLHGGISKRKDIQIEGDPNTDWYTGSGRIHQEFFIVHQGPFQSLSYNEGYDPYSLAPMNLYKPFIGGYHTIRNPLIEKSSHQFEPNFSYVNKLLEKSRNPKYKLSDARIESFNEFIEAIYGNIKSDELKSDLLDHKASVILLTGVYLSGARGYHGKNPIIELPFELN